MGAKLSASSAGGQPSLSAESENPFDDVLPPLVVTWLLKLDFVKLSAPSFNNGEE